LEGFENRYYAWAKEHSKVQLTCFTRTKVQVLTQKAEGLTRKAWGLGMLTCADVCWCMQQEQKSVRDNRCKGFQHRYYAWGKEHSKLQITCFTRTKVQVLTQKAEGMTSKAWDSVLGLTCVLTYAGLCGRMLT
jgi:hypothetical protein